MKASLNTRTKKVVGYVRDAVKPMTFLELSALQSYFESQSEEYFLIIHDRDIDENGETVIPHIHFVATMRNACRLSKFLSEIATVCEVHELAVSIDKYLYFEMSVQYLIHKNNKEKYQYSEDEIVTNSNDLAVYLSVQQDVFDYESVCAVIVRVGCLSQLMLEIGLKRYHAYRNVIRDLWQEYADGKLFYKGRYYGLRHYSDSERSEQKKEEAC